MIFLGNDFCLEPIFNRIYQNFCFLVKRMCQFFVIHLKLFFFSPPDPSFLKFWAPFHLGALGNCLTRPREGPALETFNTLMN